jgi:hypothetical protein
MCVLRSSFDLTWFVSLERCCFAVVGLCGVSGSQGGKTGIYVNWK